MGHNKKAQGLKFFIAFAAPTVFIFITVVLIPFVYGVIMTFTDTNGISSSINWIGFKNYIQVIKDKAFWSSLLITIEYVLASVIFTNALSFIIAYLLTLGIKGQSFLRSAFFTPNLLGGIVLGLVWRFIFQKFFVYIGTAFHIPILEVSWLADSHKALIAMIIVSIWKTTGYLMIIYIAGFTSIPKDLLEAADIDGCNKLQKILKIQAPMMASSFVICTFLTITGSFMAYDINVSLTKGDPFGSTTLISLNIFREAFVHNNYGKGQAEAIILFIIIAFIASLQVYLGKKAEVEQ
ncbi:MAG: binding-protein-dependent transport system inner rane component [Firmicutes bacterium]|nr:binding-protein-dependent transport system inner rane component [Bacillota bacterium]